MRNTELLLVLITEFVEQARYRGGSQEAYGGANETACGGLSKTSWWGSSRSRSSTLLTVRVSVNHECDT